MDHKRITNVEEAVSVVQASGEKNGPEPQGGGDTGRHDVSRQQQDGSWQPRDDTDEG